MVSLRVRRNASAWALPRPSATASAKLANSTVNQSHRLIWKAKPRWCWPCSQSRTNRKVVRVAVISTTNITGLRAIARGSSFLKALPIAGTRMAGSNTLLACCLLMVVLSEEGAGLHRQMFDDGAQRQGGEECEPAHDQDDADQKADEQPAMGGKGAGRDRHDLLGG